MRTKKIRTLLVPDPRRTDPSDLGRWIKASGFPLDDEEEELLHRLERSRYTSEWQNVETIYALRILYWQVVGWLRAAPAKGSRR